MLYNTTPVTADRKRKTLSNAVAELLNKNPVDVIMLVEPYGEHVLAKFLIENPSEEDKVACDTHETSKKLRDAIIEYNIIPHQKRNCTEFFFILISKVVCYEVFMGFSIMVTTRTFKFAGR